MNGTTKHVPEKKKSTSKKIAWSVSCFTYDYQFLNKASTDAAAVTVALSQAHQSHFLSTTRTLRMITIGKQSIIYSQRMKMIKHALDSTHVWFTKLVSVWIRVSYNSCDSGMARGCSKPNQFKLRNGGKVSYKLVRIRKFWIPLLCVNSFIYKDDVLYFNSFNEIIIHFLLLWYF